PGQMSLAQVKPPGTGAIHAVDRCELHDTEGFAHFFKHIKMSLFPCQQCCEPTLMFLPADRPVGGHHGANPFRVTPAPQLPAVLFHHIPQSVDAVHHDPSSPASPDASNCLICSWPSGRTRLEP